MAGFDDDVAELVGMPAAMPMTCPRIGDAQFGMCQSMTAVEAARVLFVHAIPQYSVPTVIVSDSEPAFAAKVTQALAKLFGIKEWGFGPVSSPQHHGHSKVERRVAPYKRAIEAAMAAGTIPCRRTMEVVMASTLITQLTVAYGTTAFTRRTGAVPRTHRDLFASAPEPDFDLKVTVQRDTDVLKALTAHVEDLCDWHQEMRDRAHRKTLYPKLAEAARKMHMGTDFFMIPGGMVSYSGERWLLLDTTGSPNQPMTARIQQATHADALAEKVVRYDTLTPLVLASMREQHL